MSQGVSVVIPTCNRLGLLHATLESVLRQTRSFREVIVVDNGAQSAAPVTARFAGRVELMTLPPGSGVQRARNAGIERAATAWVATLDDDDHYRSDFLETVSPIIADGRADIIFADHRKQANGRLFPKSNFDSAPLNYWEGVRPDDPDVRWSLVGRFPLERLLYFIPFYPSSMLISKDLFHRTGGYDPRVNGIPTEDIEFLVRALHRGRLAICWEELVDYHVHVANTSGNHDRQRVGRWRVFEFIRAHGEALPPSFLAHLEANLLRRRRDVFDFCFHKRRFGDFDEVSATLGAADWTLARRLYRAVRSSPAPLRGPLGRLVSSPGRLRSFVRRRRPKSIPIDAGPI